MVKKIIGAILVYGAASAVASQLGFKKKVKVSYLLLIQLALRSGLNHRLVFGLSWGW